MSKRNLLIDVIGLLLIALVVVVGYKLSPVLLPKADVVLQPEPGCDLQRAACVAVVGGGGRIVVDTSLRPIPLAKPFRMQVTVAGLEARRVEVDFAGIDMNMGLIRPVLAAEGGGRFGADVSLPVCITGAMDWQATVVVETAGERLAIPLRFRAGEN